MIASPRPDGLPQPRDTFEAAVVAYMVDLFASHPTWGTAVGYHAVDGRWPDLSEPGRQERLAMLRHHEAVFEGLDEAALDIAQRVDRRIVLEQIEEARFSEEVLRAEAWDALVGVYLMGSGLFGVLAREYAPWSQRGAALLSRMEGLPALAAQLLEGLTGLPDRPVALLQLDTALAQLDGVTELIGASSQEARTRADRGEAPELVAPLETAAEAATSALDELRERLDGDVRTRASGDGRLGPELFARKLRLTLGSDLSPDDLRTRAWADYHAVRSELLRLARLHWGALVPGEPMPEVPAGDAAGESDLVRRVLDAIAAEHQRPEGLLAYCEAEVARIEAFCREQGVITLPAEPLVITWTPTFLRAFGRAFLDSPGPLDEGQVSQFWITPPDESEGPDAVESYLREENDRMLRALSIHEGIPGHYLQLVASSHSNSLVRRIFVNGMFAEGWAVYVEQVMVEAGYAADDPGFLLTHWKMYLRAVVNAILDVETHTGDMTEEEALALMVDGAWQERDEARGKWLRARISSTQLSTYFVGSVEMWEMEIAARRRAAVTVGASPSDVPPQRVAGGIGPTPGFDRRAHLEAVISHGSPPVKWCRYLLLGEGSGTIA